jgi:hypothetical protein
VHVDLRIEDIPQSVLDEAGTALQDFLVPIFAFSQQQPMPKVTLIGSGTLVEVEDTFHVLTAAHVWHATKGSEQIGFVLTTYPSMFALPRELISAKELWDQQHPEWGPDLALLEIPRAHVARVSAHKSFLNLPQQKATVGQYPPDTTKGLWAVTGMVEEFSNIQHHSQANAIEADVQARAYFSGIQGTHQRDGYDYFDPSAKLTLAAVPSSFGGVSGGGLWQVGLSSTAAGKIQWDGKRHFRGVAFWQSPVLNERRVVRCHGPRSIYDTAWAAWALPLSA